jgi:hypothetical protein
MAIEYLGDTTCGTCGGPLPWRQNEKGSLSAFCARCDLQVRALSGTKAKDAVLQSLGKPNDPPKEKPADPTPKTTPTPAKKPFGPFGL